ncbi:forkhead box protein M1 [Amia ocellicauda]|uniref:forkhead box protein M1 n=1 Tax=Amia ocellicauda TaxID=2972642 RepID=UPI003463E16D
MLWKKCETHVLNTMENQENEENGADLDDSLTNINWLGRFSCTGMVPEKKKASPKIKTVKPPKCPSLKRPPYSYSELIKLALNSAPGKRLALPQIYAWVQDHFPYYKYCANPGWKNSIRHSLSIRDIFVRETENSGRTSFWTMKANTEPDILPSLKQINTGVPKMPNEKKGGVKKIHPLLPRGIAPCLVSVPVFINPPAFCQASVAPHRPTFNTQATTVQRVIVPKLPISRGIHTVVSSQVPALTNTVSRESTIAKHQNKCPPQRPRLKRKQKHQTLKEPEPLLQDTPGLSNDSGVDSERNISSEEKTDSGVFSSSPFKTPTKKKMEVLTTSTPCTNSALLSPNVSLQMGDTPPKSLDSFLDGSFFKSPDAVSLGYESLGFAPLRENAKSSHENNNSERELSEFTFLGFTPIKGARVTEGPGFEHKSESVFADFTLPDIEEGTDMASISWSAFASDCQ